MAVARLVSLFESKTVNRTASTTNTDPNINPDSFTSRTLRLSPTMSSPEDTDTFHISIQPHHFSHKRASRQRYYDSSSSSATSSPDASPSSSYRKSNRFSFRSMSPMSFSGPHTRRFSQHLALRRIPSHVDLALAAERDEQGLDLLEPRPVAAVEAACFGRSASPPVVLENIFEVLEGHRC
jgi:hypothetical protein